MRAAALLLAALLAGCADVLRPDAPAEAAACDEIVPLAAAPAPAEPRRFVAPSVERGHPTAFFTRDAWGVPLIEAATTAEAHYAAGYALADDRLWQLEVYRRAGQGTLAEVLGEAYLPVDVLARTLGYTPAERAGMLAGLEPDTLVALQAYVDGINVRVADAALDPDRLPFEFTALGLQPALWTVDDVAAWATTFFFLADFDVGSERANADLYLRLLDAHGEAGARMFDDVVPAGSGEPPVTAPAGAWRYPSWEPRRAPADQVDAVRAARDVLARAATTRSEAAGPLPLALPTMGSNMVLVAPSRSESGGALLLGGPQVAYTTPALFWEADLVVDGARWHWIHLPGSALGIGRWESGAFSVTVGYGDQTDLVLLDLDPADPEGYVFAGEKHAFEPRVERLLVADRAGTVEALAGLDPLGLARRATGGAPRVVEETVRSSHLGPVVAYDPEARWAVAAMRAHRYEELAVLDLYLDEGLPATSKDPAALRAALDRGFDRFPVSFNVFAAYSDGAVLYRQTGRAPERSDAYDRRLPLPPSEAAVWSGRWASSCMPRASDPADGYLVNWNNVPARGFPNMAPTPWWWGDDHRVLTLDEELRAELAEPTGLDDVNDAMRRAALRDGAASRIVPRLVALAGEPAPPLDTLDAWARAGAPIRDADGDGAVDDPGVLVWETWRPLLEEAIAGDELGDAVRTFSWGTDLGANNTDHHGSGAGEGFLAALLDARTAHDWWDDVRTPGRERAEDVVRSTLPALRDALHGAPERPMSRHVFGKLGAGPEVSLPQMNRGSVNFLVDASAPGIRTALPPGQSGHVSTSEGVGVSSNRHATDQVSLYAAFEYKEY